MIISGCPVYFVGCGARRVVARGTGNPVIEIFMAALNYLERLLLKKSRFSLAFNYRGIGNSCYRLRVLFDE